MKVMQTVPKFNRDLGTVRAQKAENGLILIERWNEALGEWVRAFMGGEIDPKQLANTQALCVGLGTGLVLENIQELIEEAKQ